MLPAAGTLVCPLRSSADGTGELPAGKCRPCRPRGRALPSSGPPLLGCRPDEERGMAADDDAGWGPEAR